jgi:hypothetical protein
MLIQEMLDSAEEGYKPKPELGYDLCDDMMCFMNNEPSFYRKDYFPVIHKFKEYVQAGKEVHPRVFENLVKKAYEVYQNKFPVEGLERTLDKDMLEQLCTEIHRSETENIENGHYDSRKK